MAVFDLKNRSIVLKIVYYGCARGGKTTNLETLHRLTDPQGKQGFISIATQNDRTLFFDLLPLALGQVGGLTVRVKLYTVPGQVHYEVTRRQVLGGADAVVMVMDSSPHMQVANGAAFENLRHNLERNKLDSPTIPIVLQWNKRDHPCAVSAQQLEAAFNEDGLPSHQAIATKGVGVLETFATVLKAAISHAYQKAGKPALIPRTLDDLVRHALNNVGAAAAAMPAATAATSTDREEWAENERDRPSLDQEKLLAEAVQTSIELADRLEGARPAGEAGERRQRMLEALGRAASALADPAGPAPQPGLLAALLEAAARTRGSLLLFGSDARKMEEHEIVPAGGAEPLNLVTSASLGSVAHRLSQSGRPRLIEDLQNEVFFNAAPPGAETLAQCYLVPIISDDVKFGTLVIHAPMSEHPFEAGEQGFWTTVGLFLGMSLQWRTLRKKVPAAETPARSLTS